MSEEKKGSIVRKPKSMKNYVNGPDFHKSLVEYNEKKKASVDKKPEIPRYVGECIIKIAENLGSKFNFLSYSYKEEMISDAIEKMIEKVDLYDVDYNTKNPNPFAYFTQIAWNMFLQRIDKEKKEQYIKHKNFEKTYFQDMEDIEDLFNNEEHNKVIEEFEQRKAKKAANNYANHKNLSYSKNRKKKIKEGDNE